MLFHSPGFLFLFLPLFLVVMHLSLKGRWRMPLLVGFSYLFYSGAEPFFLLILLTSTLTDYWVALRLANSDDTSRRRLLLMVSVLVNIGLLSFFKLGPWVFPELQPMLVALGWPAPRADWFAGYLLPAGISFYTFQSLAYTIDVYRGKIEPTRDLVGFAGYVAYLPQLIAGPIERYAHLGPQLQSLVERRLRPHWSAGVDRIALGLVQKLLLADTCGEIVDRLVAAGGTPDLVTSWAIGLGFGMQIYFDFAAYTHMAIGTSLLLGVRLSENFLAPYQAASIQEFWRRWHVTLSSWFRDYVYVPLGGSHRGLVRTMLNILLTFLLCGLWHGAGWNFLIWGGLNGVLLGLYHWKQVTLPHVQLPRWFAILLTFAVVQMLWVPFRIADLDQIWLTWSGMLGLNGIGPAILPLADMLLLLLVAGGTLLLPEVARRWPGSSGWQESTALSALALLALVSTPEINQFIYFQF